MPAFTDADTAQLSAQLKSSEGLRLAAYRDTVGVLTIGYGHNCQSSPVPGVSKPGDTITREEADRLFEADLSTAVWAVRKALPWVTGLSAPRQAVLYDMAFNMGLGIPGKSGLLSFVNTLNLIELSDYGAAARGMLASKWATQVKGRAVKLAKQMETGVWA